MAFIRIWEYRRDRQGDYYLPYESSIDTTIKKLKAAKEDFEVHDKFDLGDYGSYAIIVRKPKNRSLLYRLKFSDEEILD